MTGNFDNLLHLSEIWFYNLDYLEAKFYISRCISNRICEIFKTDF